MPLKTLTITVEESNVPLVVCPQCGWVPSVAETPVDKWYAVLAHMRNSKDHKMPVK